MISNISLFWVATVVALVLAVATGWAWLWALTGGLFMTVVWFVLGEG